MHPHTDLLSLHYNSAEARFSVNVVDSERCHTYTRIARPCMCILTPHHLVTASTAPSGGWSPPPGGTVPTQTP